METKYTWKQINKALMAKGLSTSLIADILSKLVEIKQVEDECPECGHCENECICDENGNAQ